MQRGEKLRGGHSLPLGPKETGQTLITSSARELRKGTQKKAGEEGPSMEKRTLLSVSVSRLGGTCRPAA